MNPLLFISATAASTANITSYTLSVFHHPNDPASVHARDQLKQSFCAAFAIDPCSPSTAHDDDSLHIVDNFAVHVPSDQLVSVAPFFLQRRVAAFSGVLDLELQLRPNVPNAMAFALWSGGTGQPHSPIDLLNVYKQRASAKSPPLAMLPAADGANSSLWALTCSEDCDLPGSPYDLCGASEHAPGTTCRAAPLGAHLHLFYRQNDAAAVAARDEFKAMATAALSLSPAICADDYGHEQPHNFSCWLSGPGGHEADYPQDAGGSSFATGTLSLYVHSRDYGMAVGWIAMHAASLSPGLDLLLHPAFGCNFADHELWSLRRGDTPNNLHGIAAEGGWEAAEPPELDPQGNHSATATAAAADPRCVAAGATAAGSLGVHVPYDPTDGVATRAKDAFVQSLLASFPAASLVVDEPDAWRRPSSPFLAGHAHLELPPTPGRPRPSPATLFEWLGRYQADPSRTSGVASARAVDALVTPDTGCPLLDYTERAVHVGRRWPLNLHALTNHSAELRARAARPDASSSAAPATHAPAAAATRRTTRTAAAPATEEAAAGFVLYALRTPNNGWQTTASDAFVASFRAGFGATDCPAGAAASPAAEPLCNAPCVVDGAAAPYHELAEPMTTSYTRLCVPSNASDAVLGWAMLHRGASALGYEVDLLIAPLRGSPHADLTARALRAGVPWPINEAPLRAAAAAVAASDAAITAALHRQAVRYYRGEARGVPSGSGAASVTADGVGGTESAWDAAGTAATDWRFGAPALREVHLPAGGAYPSWGAPYWLETDTHYVVIEGNATFGDASDGTSAPLYAPGDLFFIRAGAVHGPVREATGGAPLRVALVGPRQLRPRFATDAPVASGCPSVNASLPPSRGYRAAEGQWRPNPSPHSDSCERNGGVWNLNFDAADATPAVLRVRWAPNCSIPFHYHPTGALYFVLYGAMYFAGDLRPDVDDAPGTLDDAPLAAGDVRWVRPGFAYGPEYNGATEPMEITVLGTESLPVFGQSPPKPYMLQVQRTVSVVFD